MSTDTTQTTGSCGCAEGYVWDEGFCRRCGEAITWQAPAPSIRINHKALTSERRRLAREFLEAHVGRTVRLVTALRVIEGPVSKVAWAAVQIEGHATVVLHDVLAIDVVA